MKFTKTIDANTTFEDIEITDYPYIGIGKNLFQKKRKIISDDELEKIISG